MKTINLFYEEGGFDESTIEIDQIIDKVDNQLSLFESDFEEVLC